MKTKRTLFSIVVFLSVFWVSILVGFDKHENPANPKNDNTSTIDKVQINALSNKYGEVASTSDRLYLYEETDTDSQTVQNTNGIDGFRRYVPVKESTISETSVSEDENSEDELRSPNTSSDLASKASLSVDDILPSLYSDIGISIANSYVNIRDKTTTDSEIIGKLYKDSAAKILDSVGDWYYIESGSVKGYVKNNYLETDISDEELIEKYGLLRILVNTDGLNVREKPDIQSKKLTVIYHNEIYPVIDLQDEWLKVDISDDKIVGYVNRDYVELLVEFEKAISKAEEEELKRIQEKEQARLKEKQNEERIKKETEVKYREEVDYAQDDLKLLACLVHSEAGNQSYEGKLAVANVVLNRVKSSKYPSTIKGVIYQPGQFAVTKNGSLAKQLERYENYSTKSQQLTIKAAKAALSGANNIGSRLYFNGYKAAVKAGHDQKKTAVKIEDHLFW